MTEIEVVAQGEPAALAKASAKTNIPVQYLEIMEEYEPDDEDIKTLVEEDGLAAAPAKEAAALYLVRASFQFYIDKAQEWTQGFIERFAPGSTAEAVRFRHLVVIRLEVPESSILIGKKGATLDSLQHVVVRAMLTIDEGFPDIMLDVDRYREKKLQRLEREAIRAAQRAERTGRPVALTPMKPAERKFIHNVLKDMEGIKTESRGADKGRHVVVESTKPASGQRRGGRGGDDRRGGGYRERDGNRESNRGGDRDGNRDGNRSGNDRGGRGGQQGGRGPSPVRADSPGREISERERQLLYGKLKAQEDNDDDESDFNDTQLETRNSMLPEYIPQDDEEREDGKLADELE